MWFLMKLLKYISSHFKAFCGDEFSIFLTFFFREEAFTLNILAQHTVLVNFLSYVTCFCKFMKISQIHLNISSGNKLRILIKVRLAFSREDMNTVPRHLCAYAIYLYYLMKFILAYLNHLRETFCNFILIRLTLTSTRLNPRNNLKTTFIICRCL